jgi:hypothetical protein
MDLFDTNLKSRETRDAENIAFSNQISMYVIAHDGRMQARLEAIAFSGGGVSGSGDGKAMEKIMQNQVNPINMPRMSAINNIGSSNTRYDYNK